MSRVRSTPEPAPSVPGVSVSGTLVVNQGPPTRVIVWPLGAVLSGLIAIVAASLVPAPFVAETETEPGAAAPDVHV